jgi:hypothetical protein
MAADYLDSTNAHALALEKFQRTSNMIARTCE